MIFKQPIVLECNDAYLDEKLQVNVFALWRRTVRVFAMLVLDIDTLRKSAAFSIAKSKRPKYRISRNNLDQNYPNC